MDYYEVLAVDPKANADEVKAAYRALQKAVHPDLAGEYASIAARARERGERRAAIPARSRVVRPRPLGVARARGDVAAEDASLMNPAPLSRWSGPARDEPESAKGRHDAVFVDESQCVGCLQCALLAPKTFFIETRHGCARAVDQWADGRDAVEDAAAACPVRCIHFVDRATELPLLERVAARLWTEGGGKIQVRSIQTYFTHRPVSTLDRVPFQLTGEPFFVWNGPQAGGVGRVYGKSSPFDVAAALKRRGVVRWPSRSGGGTKTDTSKAGAAIDAAVKAAAAAAAARAERDAWRGAKEEGEALVDENDDDDDDATTAIEIAVPVSAYIADDVGVAGAGCERGGNGGKGASAAEVARVTSLLRSGSGSGSRSGSSDDGDDALLSGSSAAATEFWEPLPVSERAASASFEEETDDGFAPSEWLAKVRSNVVASRRSSGDVAAADANVDQPPAAPAAAPAPRKVIKARSVAASLPPFSTVAAALLIAAATTNGAGDAGGAAAAEQIISVNGALWTPGPFAQFACCAVSWIVLLQATVQVVDAVVFVTTQEIHDGK